MDYEAILTALLEDQSKREGPPLWLTDVMRQLSLVWIWTHRAELVAPIIDANDYVLSAFGIELHAARLGHQVTKEDVVQIAEVANQTQQWQKRYRLRTPEAE